MRYTKKILISAAVLAGIGLGIYLIRRACLPDHEDLAAETRPIYTK